MYIRRSKSPIYELLFWGTVIIIVCNVIFSLALSLVAMTNYPGGIAITRFHKLLKNEPYVHVHISNLAAQTGVTRFTQIHDHWTYSKNESLSDDQLQGYTHLLIEAKSKYSSNLKAFAQSHNILDSIESFSQISVTYKLMPPIRIKTKPAIFILERKNFRDDIYKLSSQNLKMGEETIQKLITNEDEVEDEGQTDVENNYEKEVDNYESKEVFDKLEENEENEIEQNNNESEEIIASSITSSGTPENIGTIVDDESNDVAQDQPEQTYTKPTAKVKKIILEESKTVSRQERRRKAMAKIKSETRREVVASAKEKLKEIMKRHKNIAVDLTENNISNTFKESDDVNVRGDIPEEAFEHVAPQMEEVEPDYNEDSVMTDTKPQEASGMHMESIETNNNIDINIDSIVEEVIMRLHERKDYDDKTKPDDIKIEDRMMIQRIVEEILSERMNYKNIEVAKSENN